MAGRTDRIESDQFTELGDDDFERPVVALDEPARAVQALSAAACGVADRLVERR